MLDVRQVGCDRETLARDLLTGFFDVCMRTGLDGLLVELERAFPPLDSTDRFSLSEHPSLRAALVEQLGQNYNEGGPRNAKPRQLADCLLAALALAVSDEPDRTIKLADDVRLEVVAALASAIDVEFAPPQLRTSIIAKGRELCDPHYHSAFDRIAAQLDDRGMTMLRQPKLSLDAVQAVQKVLTDARNAVIERAARVAIDRAKETIARADADAAARIDLPITHQLTPRDVAIRRLCEPRASKAPAAVVQSLLESLTALSRLAWRPLERPVRPYAASQTFAVGDLIEHPKFGRGSVISCAAQRIEVEFADGRHTLAHVAQRK